MNHQSASVCLNSVVRESRGIRDFLEGVRPYLDAWVIVDASADPRVGEAVARLLDGLPGELIAQPFGGYAAHRSAAFEQGRHFADYCLVLDPHERLAGGSAPARPLPGPPVQALEVCHDTRSRVRRRLLRSDIDWRFSGPLRECLNTALGAGPAPLLPYRATVPGAPLAASTATILRRDALDIETALLDQPGNHRLRLALGELYAGLGDWVLAARCFELCDTDAPWPDDGWYVLYARGRAREALAQDLRHCISAYHDAFERCPARAEALYRIAVANRRHLNPRVARDIAAEARGLPLVDMSDYFERPVYDYLVDIEYARACYELGDFSTVVEVLDSVLESRSLPRVQQVWRRRIRALALEQLRHPRASAAADEAEPSAAGSATPPATPRGRSRRLTIGMATFDDYDGVYFSTLALRLYHPEVLEDTEILVIDNHPGGPCATALKDLDKWVPGYRYVPNDTLRGTAARDLVFREANADWVLCMDSHVLIEPGALRRLFDWLDGQSESRDLLQGPLLLDDLHTMHTHFEPVWRDGMYGVWGSDPRAAHAGQAPFEIAMQGLGLFACRRQAWPGFNPRFRGFGGEEGYIHEKFRQRGGRTLCLPFLRWTHRFARPLGIRYPNLWEERIRNYLIGFSELGLDTTPVRDHFREHVGGDFTDEVIERVTREMVNPFFYFDAIYCINLDAETGRWERMTARFERLGIAGRVKRFPALATPDNPHVGCSLSHRRVVAEAKYSGFDNILVIEDDAVFLDDTLAQLRQSVDELEEQRWNLLYLGGHKWGRNFPEVPGCSALEVADGLTCTHALAYNHTVFDRILADLPGDEAGMRRWVVDEIAIDQYLRRIDRALVCAPVLATQAALLPQEAPELADRFVI